MRCPSNISTDRSLQITCSSCSVSQKFPGKQIFTNSQKYQSPGFLHIVSKWKVPSLRLAASPLLSTGTFSLFLLCQGGQYFSTRNPAADPTSARRWVKRESESWKSVPLNLDLGLAFLQTCVCARLQLPRSPLHRVFTFLERSLSPTSPGSHRVSLYNQWALTHTHAHIHTHSHTRTHRRVLSLSLP